MEAENTTKKESFYQDEDARYYSDLLIRQNDSQMTAEEWSRKMIRAREKPDTISMICSKIDLGKTFIQKSKDNGKKYIREKFSSVRQKFYYF